MSRLPAKANDPIETTLEGIETDVSPLFLNATAWITVANGLIKQSSFVPFLQIERVFSKLIPNKKNKKRLRCFVFLSLIIN